MNSSDPQLISVTRREARISDVCISTYISMGLAYRPRNRNDLRCFSPEVIKAGSGEGSVRTRSGECRAPVRSGIYPSGYGGPVFS